MVFWEKYCHSTEEPNLYFEEKYGQNVWEYYFEPVSNLGYNDVESRLPQAKIEFISSPKIFRSDSNASIRQTANYYIKKYINARLHNIFGPSALTKEAEKNFLPLSAVKSPLRNKKTRLKSGETKSRPVHTVILRIASTAFIN